jgi:two-component system sensor kinase FixL
MGVGLSICRTIVEAHGGQLWMTPNPEGGTIFRFQLPVSE